MKPSDAERRIDALEKRQVSASQVEDERKRLIERFENMIRANMRMGSIWSAYDPAALRDEYVKRIARLERDSMNKPSNLVAGLYGHVLGWMVDARDAAERDIAEQRPTYTGARHLRRLDEIADMDLVVLHFGYIAGADAVLTGTPGD